MSLTSYRAAPPRVGIGTGDLPGLKMTKPPFVLLCILGRFCYVLFDRLEDLAATYSPVP